MPIPNAIDLLLVILSPHHIATIFTKSTTILFFF